MEPFDKLRQEIASLKRQSSVDYEFTALAMNDMGERIQAFGREMKEGFDQLAGRMRLQESRLSAVLQAVDRSMELNQPNVERISDLEERVAALERARDSAA